jgi:SAM-dependent methyltransferase
VTTAVRDVLGLLGYDASLVRSEFPIWTGKSIAHVEVAAFTSHERQDMTTAAIVGGRADSTERRERLLSLAQAIASPVCIVEYANQLEIWSVRAEREATSKQSTWPVGERERIAATYRAELAPAALAQAKRAGRQLTLFPVDVALLAQARRSSSMHLSWRVSEALAMALGRTPTVRAEKVRSLLNASRIVVGSLAALVVRDKYADWREDDPIGAARERFPEYFAWVDEVPRSTQPRIAEVLNILGTGVNYEALDAAVVSEVYESVLVERSQRLDLGIFYTPPDLARQIARSIPFEELEPDERVVLDPACGSGTLLLAAHDRLDSLVPMQADPVERHHYLTSHLVGYDSDQFAAEIARLALLLHALPAGDSWRIKVADTLSLRPGHDASPSVIISNPPWRDVRSVGGKRRQVADAFLEWMVRSLRPGGFGAVVLPSSWLVGRSSRSSREFLKEHASVFETWRLPEGTFQSSAHAPCVVFFRRAEADRNTWLFRRVISRNALGRFYETGASEEQSVGGLESSLRTDTWLRGPLDSYADLLSAARRLADVATVTAGPVPEPPVRDRGGTGPARWLRTARGIPHFGALRDEDCVPVNYPAEFHRAAEKLDTYLLPKVLVSADRAPSNPWRLKVFRDDVGVVPRDSLHMVVPKSMNAEALDVLLGVLGSSVAQCWVDTYETKRAISTDLLRSVPVPDQEWFPSIAESVRRVVDLVAIAGDVSDELVKLDQLVCDALGLPPEAHVRLSRHFAGFRAPEGRVRYPSGGSKDAPHDSDVQTRYFGSVLDISSSAVRLWVPGITPDEGTTFDLPPQFPGWLLRPGMGFEVDVVSDGLSGGRYAFQARSYQSPENLLSTLAAREP